MKSANSARIKILPLIKTFLMGKHFAALFTPSTTHSFQVYIYIYMYKYTFIFNINVNVYQNFNHPRKMPVILSKIYSFFRHALHVIIFSIFISTDILFLLYFFCSYFGWRLVVNTILSKIKQLDIEVDVV